MLRPTLCESDPQLQMRILDQMADAVITLDRNGRFAYWNRAANRLFHLTERQALGKLPKEAEVYPWLRSDNEHAASQAVVDNGVWCGESAHTNGSGREVCLASTITALSDADGQPAGLLAVIREVTQAKRIEIERTRRIEELQRAMNHLKVLERLIPICSHCKRIRDEQGAWHAIEVYINQRFRTKFTHGICPACVQQLHPDYLSDSQ